MPHTSGKKQDGTACDGELLSPGQVRRGVGIGLAGGKNGDSGAEQGDEEVGEP